VAPGWAPRCGSDIHAGSGNDTAWPALHGSPWAAGTHGPPIISFSRNWNGPRVAARSGKTRTKEADSDVLGRDVTLSDTPGAVTLQAQQKTVAYVRHTSHF
jgi:hypothetical protein